MPIVDARVTPERDEVILLGMVECREPGFSGIDQTGVELDAAAGGHCLEALEVFAFRRSIGSKIEGATVGCHSNTLAWSKSGSIGATSIMPVTFRYGKPYSLTVQLIPQKTNGMVWSL